MNNPTLLNKNDISKHLKTENLNISLFDSVSSTNALLKEKALLGEKEGTVIIALSQTDGRGRYNRKFYSDFGGIYLSILLKPDLNTADTTLLTAASAVAVSNAIEDLSDKKTEIKWVNDILIDGKKVCGILCEGGFCGREYFIVVGIGINVYPLKNGFDDEIKDIAGTVFDMPSKEKTAQLCARVIDNVFYEYKSLKSLEFLNTYRKKSCVLDKTVSIMSQGEVINCGKVLNIDDNCNLIVKLQNGEINALSSGEVSIMRNS